MTRIARCIVAAALVALASVGCAPSNRDDHLVSALDLVCMTTDGAFGWRGIDDCEFENR